ncbi:hypothetical protein [Anabaena sp. CCY 0017]|uniref:hypothetical protein n=1 Tax=Anabaena sp. CCY 0017 TaxID=3103866 RepID=UPI0039C655FA
MKNSKSITSNLVILGSLGLLFLGACSNTNQVANTETPATPIAETPAASVAPVAQSNNEHGASKGGQVVETGTYHLEFLADKEAGGSHLDLYLLTGDTHETVPDANVTAEVQTPDGTEKTLPFTYNSGDKHYTAMLNEAASGQYQVRITADVKGEKVNGRFSFNR